ncbi:MAG: hypothetical protein ACE15B_04485 [Bryobacteraceae bacterium]
MSLIDEGTERVLDIFQERAGVNTLMPAVFSFSSGTAGRQSQGQPLPDHGRQAYDEDLRGGNFARVHPQYYRDTAIDPAATQAPDHPRFDVLGELVPAAKKRGMKVIGLIQDHFPEKFPNVGKFQERDFNGAHCETLCKNNPYYRNFLAGLVEDLIRSYPIDGLMFVCEQTGAFSNTLGSRLRGKRRGLAGTRGCFCEFCREKARRQDIPFDRVLKAFGELEKFVAAGRARQRPPDGYYVTLWRLMLRYPELLIWEHFFHEGVREAYAVMHDRVKSVRRDAMFGLHIWHNFTLSPLYRAEQDLAEMAKCSDFFKVALYHNCGGPRMATYIDSVSETIYGDVPPAELLQYHYRVLGYSGAPYERLRRGPIGGEYVYREAKRSVEGAAGTPVWPGIDVDIPIQSDDLGKEKSSTVGQSTRASVRESARQSFQAGAQGIVISRKYSEMRLDSLSGVGDAIRELKVNT